MRIGCKVCVLPPFNRAYSGEYEVVEQSESGAWRIDVGAGELVDFDAQFIEEV